MTDRPLLLLDVDGPLNPYGARFLRHRGYVTHRLWPTNWSARQPPGSRRLRRGLRVRLHPGHGERILALPYEAGLGHHLDAPGQRADRAAWSGSPATCR